MSVSSEELPISVPFSFGVIDTWDFMWVLGNLKICSFLTFLCICMLYLYVCMCTLCMTGALVGSKRASEPLGTGVTDSGGDTSAGNQTQVLGKSRIIS